MLLNLLEQFFPLQSFSLAADAPKQSLISKQGHANNVIMPPKMWAPQFCGADSILQAMTI